MSRLLPALVLPNADNALDSTVLLPDATSTSASQFLSQLGGGGHLRLMVSSTEPGTCASPRVTWQASNGSAVVALAFEKGQDSAGRVVSAALLLDAVAMTELLPSALGDRLGSEDLAELERFLAVQGEGLSQQCLQARSAGYEGGQLVLEKKKLEVSSGRLGWGS